MYAVAPSSQIHSCIVLTLRIAKRPPRAQRAGELVEARFSPPPSTRNYKIN